METTSYGQSHHAETKEWPGERDNAKKRKTILARCTQARTTTHAQPGRTTSIRGQVKWEESIRFRVTENTDK